MKTQIISSGNGNSVIQSGGKLYINGDEINNVPPSTFGHSTVQNGNKIFINGYKYDFKTKTFKFSLFAYIDYVFS